VCSETDGLPEYIREDAEGRGTVTLPISGFLLYSESGLVNIDWDFLSEDLTRCFVYFRATKETERRIYDSSSSSSPLFLSFFIVPFSLLQNHFYLNIDANSKIMSRFLFTERISRIKSSIESDKCLRICWMIQALPMAFVSTTLSWFMMYLLLPFEKVLDLINL